ncbi:CD4-2 molecule, tandem duplicate 2 [Syngnathoides biaculeatus]|uniref:CD4-2 molecule, tandem duplicate 2 n=1 Tax=Syngnathoides biaculeatus TaxID=300417 RepID=UPI002ADE0DBA|nr:CD4-2 molecule, tandem duplicate 2 [Syngnathoides biaculeatus]XP_061675809.1 CD4-2 molecule, tandem duplicate 2 [Syngnathoides biaculeatus]
MHFIRMKTLAWLPLVLVALQLAGAKLFHTIAGQTVTIECGIDEFTGNLLWRHCDVLVVQIGGTPRMLHKNTKGVGSRSKVKEETNLEITQVKEGDAGQFTCLVGKKTSVHTLVVVSVSVEPAGELRQNSSAELRCSVAGLPPDAEVHWRRPGGTRRGSRGIVRLHPVEANDAGKWQCVFYHEGVKYIEEIEINVKKVSLTTSSPSAKDLGYSSAPSTQPGLLELGWWLLLAGGLVVLLLLSLVLLLSIQIRRRKKRSLVMKNVRKPMNGRQYCQCPCPTAAAVPLRPGKKKKPPVEAKRLKENKN